MYYGHYNVTIGNAEEREVAFMSNNERKEMIENIAERFTQMDDADKSYIVGYMAGKQEERQKWEQQGKTTVVTVKKFRNAHHKIKSIAPK